MRRLFLAAALPALPVSAPAQAQVPMTGVFVAEATCPATPSIRNVDDNPGNVATQAGRTYALIGRNAVPGSHYYVRVPGAEPDRRWVAYGCGRVEEAGVSVGDAAPRSQEPAAGPGRTDDYVLAASWQPAFCETRPRVTECREGGRDDAGFSLHGLWPQPRGRDYCGVDARTVALDERGDWLDLPELTLTTETRARLDTVMPGTASGLDRHEWVRHGTCFEGNVQAYYDVSIRLMDELNASLVRDLFEGAIGERLGAAEIRTAFDQAFGPGAGARVLVDCVEADGRTLVRELRIELSGLASEPLAQMIAAAEPVPPGCRGGEIDAAGF